MPATSALLILSEPILVIPVLLWRGNDSNGYENGEFIVY